jgi:predicted nucleic acid-binding protein
LSALADLPRARSATDDEVLRLIDLQGLAGSGIGYVDAHLLAAVRLTGGATLWTRDRRLHQVADQIGVALPQ